MATSPTSAGKTLVNTKGGLRMVCVDERDRSPFELKEPRWQSDAEHLICNKCGKRFSFKNRRHHCRRCGRIYCGNCCSTRVSLPRLSFVDPQRVCKDCETVARKENEFFDNHLKVLQNGAEFIVDDTGPLQFRCCLDPKNDRELFFECIHNKHEAAHEAIDLTSIVAIQCLTDPMKPAQDGGAQLVGIVLKYTAFHSNETQQIKLQIPPESSTKKQSVLFLVLLQKAMRMLFEPN